MPDGTSFRTLSCGISLETQQPIANRYVIASHISNDAAVSYHSAFEFYGYSNQVFYETQVTSESRFRDFKYDGVTYRRIAPRITGGITEINGTRVTTLERTVIDSINLFEKIGGLEELLRCLALIPTLDEAALSACLAEYESGFLYQKTGYILSAFAASLGLSDSFFAKCKSHLPKGKSYLSSESQGFIWHEEWKLYAPNTPVFPLYPYYNLNNAFWPVFRKSLQKQRTFKEKIQLISFFPFYSTRFHAMLLSKYNCSVRVEDEYHTEHGQAALHRDFNFDSPVTQ